MIGIGGIVFRAKDPTALRAWYAQRLGIDVQDWGGAPFEGGKRVWSILAGAADYFGPSGQQSMVN